jgi:hypothetical protein
MDRQERVNLKEFSTKLNVINFDNIINKCGKKKKRHSELLPNNIRALVVGPSNSGKTNVIFNLLFSPNGLRFCNVFVFSKSLYQEKYKFLQETLSSIPSITFKAFSENEQVPPPEQIPPNSVVIFDDVICENQNNIRQYFTMGRHNQLDIFYLSQTYSKIPKQLIRDNSNLILSFRMDHLNLKHLYRDHVSPDMSFERFESICRFVWSSSPNGFLTIDKENKKNRGRYRNQFDTYITDI